MRAGLRRRGSPLTGSERHQHQPEVLLCHLRAGFDASTAVEIGEAATEEPTGGVPDSA